ncbi:MAG: thiol-activated cytolysin [Lentimonas sp.]|jgi:thiol-activated cytolysin
MNNPQIYLAIFLLVSLSQCKDKDEDPTATNRTEMEAALFAGGNTTAITKKVLTSTKDSFYSKDGFDWKCTTEKFDIEDGIGGSGGFPLFNPNANVIYPGNLLQGSSLRKATPDVIAVGRAGGTISYDIIDGNTNSSFTVDAVSKSSIADGMNQIISGSNTLPANFSFSYTHIQSREQFALEVNADFENAFLELEGKFAMETDNSYSSYLVRLDQQYYTMSFDIPTDISQLFAPDVTAADLAKYIGPGNPATYISDVTYGRIYYLLVESTSSALDIEAAISGSFSGISGSGSGSVETSFYEELNNLKIKMFAYGGEAGGTLQTAGSLDIASLSDKLAAAGDINNGRPLSYVVRNAYDNQIVAMPVAVQYDVVTCKELGETVVLPSLTAHWGRKVAAMLEEVGGNVGAIVQIGDDRHIYNKAGTHYLIDKNGELSGPHELAILNDLNIPISPIGAADKLTINFTINGTDIRNHYYYFNELGNTFSLCDLDHNWQTTPTVEYSISEFAGGSCPFNGEGIGAISNWKWNNQVIAINRNGTKVSYAYNPSGSELIWTAAFPVSSNLESPFDAIGALVSITVGSKFYTLAVNFDGTKYAIHDASTKIWDGAYDF